MTEPTVYRAMRAYNEAVTTLREKQAQIVHLSSQIADLQLASHQAEATVNKTREALLRLVESKAATK